jgi:hypothetical protein
MASGRMRVNERLSALAGVLQEAGLPHEQIQTITGRVSVFWEMFDCDSGKEPVLVERLQEEVDELVEDLAVAVACLYALEGDEWKVLVQRTGADYAYLDLGKKEAWEFANFTVHPASDDERGRFLDEEFEGDFCGRDFFD